MKKNHKPKKDKVEAFKEINKFITSQVNNEEKSKMYAHKNKKFKMPYKMYQAINKSVKDKYEKRKFDDKANEVIGESHRKKKLMTRVITNKIENKKLKKNEKKQRIQMFNKKARLQDGVLKVSKSFVASFKK